MVYANFPSTSATGPVVVLYGGTGTGDQALGDMFWLSPEKIATGTIPWNDSTPNPSQENPQPPALTEAAMAYDPNQQRVVLVGGYDGGSAHSPYTYTWNGQLDTQHRAMWKQQAADPRMLRRGAAIWYDITSQHVMLFGGELVSNGAESVDNHLFKWDWNGSDSGRWDPVTADDPEVAPNRAFAASAYDSSLGGALLEGGQGVGSSIKSGVFLCKSMADGSVHWVYLGSDVPRASGSLAFDSTDLADIAFGGNDPAPVKELRYYNGDWHTLNPPAGQTVPGKLNAPTMVYVDAGFLVIFGGTNGGTLQNITYKLMVFAPQDNLGNPPPYLQSVQWNQELEVPISAPIAASAANPELVRVTSNCVQIPARVIEFTDQAAQSVPFTLPAEDTLLIDEHDPVPVGSPRNQDIYFRVYATLGRETVEYKFKVVTAITVNALTINSATIAGGVNGTVYLNKPAPAGGMSVTLKLDGSSIQTASSTQVKVSAGALSATFTWVPSTLHLGSAIFNAYTPGQKPAATWQANITANDL